MPDFACGTCGKTFSLKQSVLDKYPGWTPRTCMGCKKKGGGKRSSSSYSGKSDPEKGRSYARRNQARKRKVSAPSATIEENLTTTEVLARYSGGPQTGLFTDGGCTPNPGPGGWGVVWVEDGKIQQQKHGHDASTTNNRMELTAIIEALELLDDDAEVTLFSDSMLCINTLTKWAAGWEKNGWKRKQGEVKNLDLVQRAYALVQAHPNVTLQHVKAHSGQLWNEYADSLATAWRREEV